VVVALTGDLCCQRYVCINTSRQLTSDALGHRSSEFGETGVEAG
jgi:hypothetical protein